MKNGHGQIVIYQTEDGVAKIDVSLQNETVWLSLDQMAQLFQRDKSTISRHIKNVFDEGELMKNSVVANFATTASDGKTYKVDYFNLDVIISVGYRVKSQRGVQFRIWATGILKEYFLKGYAKNDKRLKQLNHVIKVIKRTADSLDAMQVLSVVERYTKALDILDDYDHERIIKPEIGSHATYIITYKECRNLIDEMKFNNSSSVFGVEKDESLKGSIGAIYQTFGSHDLYPSLEEKAANLLYFITKNHSFLDGNKRIAAALFLHFLNQNHALFRNNEKRIADYTLVALTLMIAESRPDEKEVMVNVVMNCLGDDPESQH